MGRWDGGVVGVRVELMGGWYTNLLAPARVWVDDTGMIKILRQWISRALALALIGPIASSVAGNLHAPDGSGAHTLLTGDAFVYGLIALVIVGALTSVAGVVGGVLGGRREGFLAMGFVLGWVAWTSGRVGQVYQLTPEAGTSIKLAIEGVVLIVFVVIAGVIVSKNDADDPMTSFAPKRLAGWMRQTPMLGTMGAALVAGGVVAMFLGSYDFPGQSTGVGFMGGIVGGVVGAMTAASMHGKDEHQGTPFAPIMLGVMLAGVIFPLVTIVFPGFGSMEEMVLKGTLPGFVIVSPAAWVMGAMLGVPVGHSWVEHSQEKVHQGAHASK